MLRNNLAKKIKNFNKDKNYIRFETLSLGELLTEDFICNNTEFSDFDQMIYVSGIKTGNNLFTEVFISNEWNEFVNRTTEFNGWREMVECAVKNYISNE